MNQLRTLALETKNKIGEKVALAGWIDVRRDHGKLIFLDLRDRSGKVQVVVTPKDEKLHEIADTLRSEWVVGILGEVKERPEDMKNLELPTGSVEIKAEKIDILNEAETPPFDIYGDGREIDEELRLEYRYLDLRRERLQKNLKLRAKFLNFVREFLTSRDFIEIETPMLTKSTPEGSRDFVVPSRQHQGKFYALPQSPQQYKQLLMTGGFERYFQIARAMRDEDTRADRSYEHTQIDLEMSFVEQKDVMGLVEEMISDTVEKFGFKIFKKPFPVFNYEEAIKKFGEDKFDLRPPAGEAGENPESDELAFAWVVDFPVFERDKEGNLTYSHNPFTAPKTEHVKDLLEGKNLENLVSLQYDLVCNGYEVGGGGVRIHKAEVLEKVFEIIGHKKEEIKEKFGHMLEAFRLGTPPHGGIALGVERIIMILQKEEAIREVTAFPMTGDGRDPMMNSPSEISPEQLKELGIKTEKPKPKK